MLFLLDTCALNHICELHEAKIIDLREVLVQFRIGITHAVLKEWENYGLAQYFSPARCYLLPVQNHDIVQMQARFPFFQDFDEADQTLLWISMQKSVVILSDDGDLNAAALSIGKKALFLPDFCLFLVKTDYLTKNSFRKALKFWENVHRYRLAELKRWRTSLNLLT